MSGHAALVLQGVKQGLALEAKVCSTCHDEMCDKWWPVHIWLWDNLILEETFAVSTQSATARCRWLSPGSASYYLLCSHFVADDLATHPSQLTAEDRTNSSQRKDNTASASASGDTTCHDLPLPALRSPLSVTKSQSLPKAKDLGDKEPYVTEHETGWNVRTRLTDSGESGVCGCFHQGVLFYYSLVPTPPADDCGKDTRDADLFAGDCLRL